MCPTEVEYTHTSYKPIICLLKDNQLVPVYPQQYIITLFQEAPHPLQEANSDNTTTTITTTTTWTRTTTVTTKTKLAGARTTSTGTE